MRATAFGCVLAVTSILTNCDMFSLFVRIPETPLNTRVVFPAVLDDRQGVLGQLCIERLWCIRAESGVLRQSKKVATPLRPDNLLAMSTQQPDLDFASVVRVAAHLPNWSQIGEDDDPLVQLHSKFWGKTLTCEDPEPSKAAKSELTDVDKGMRVDDQVDDDFIPGCAILNIGIDDLPFQKIWIRADYIRIYDYIENRETPSRLTNLLPPAAVVTGHPGTGKSVWVYYALCRRLVERKPVIWYRDQVCYLFLKEGVFVAPPDFPSSYFRIFVWTLVDSDENKEGAPPRLLTPGTRLYVIYVTSPRKERWARMNKTVRDVRIIMNPWRRKEINNAASIYQISDADRQRINLLYERLGPTPKLTIDFFHELDSLIQFENDVQNEIKGLTSESLERIFDDSNSLKMDQLSHKICLLSRNNLENVASLPIVGPITSYVHSRLVCRLRTVERREQVRLYKRFAKTSDSRALAGIAFEAAGQAMLQDGMDLQLVPMWHHPATKRIPLPPWHSSHVLQHVAQLEQLRQNALGKTLSLEVRPSRILEYTDNGPLSIEANVFYLPEMSNQVAFDAFILLNGILYLFQFTIGDHHDFKPGLKNFFATCNGIPAMEHWRLVFLIPPNHTLVAPQPWFLDIRAIRFYSAIVAL